jgi:hypothetical protein
MKKSLKKISLKKTTIIVLNNDGQKEIYAGYFGSRFPICSRFPECQLTKQ